mgnify:CR=1 FL=1
MSRSKVPQTIWRSAVELNQFLDSCGYTFCFIGGISLQRWGQPRSTRDIDLNLLAGFGNEHPIIETILKRYQSRIDDPVGFALRARILLLQNISGTSIDLSLGGLPFEDRMQQRASPWSVPGAGVIRTCSAEDLVVLKAFAARRQDWLDLDSVVKRQGSGLDRRLIEDELTPLSELKEEPEILIELQKVFRNHD